MTEPKRSIEEIKQMSAEHINITQQRLALLQNNIAALGGAIPLLVASGDVLEDGRHGIRLDGIDEKYLSLWLLADGTLLERDAIVMRKITLNPISFSDAVVRYNALHCVNLIGDILATQLQNGKTDLEAAKKASKV